MINDLMRLKHVLKSSRYEGRTAAESGLVFGHENMGIVDEVGPAVTVSATIVVVGQEHVLMT